MHNENLEDWYYFSSPVYKIKLERYLQLLKDVSEQYDEHDLEIDEIYPIKQSKSFELDKSISDFVKDVSQTGWNILGAQGYDMDNLKVYVGELWSQTHHKYSSMDVHTHGYGSQLSAFYILDCNEDSPKLCIHDPRPTKTQVELPEKFSTDVKFSTRVIEFDLEPGLLFITNSWLPHSFTRNRSDEPFKIIHINMFVENVVENEQLPIVI